MKDPRSLGIALLRVVVAALLFIHGLARVWLGIVDDFGDVITAWGFPLGHAIAWTITAVELAGGVVLAAGYLVLPLSVWFALVLASGIALVHAKAGWFVVGAGRNGMEYSVLLIASLAVIALTHPPIARPTGAAAPRAAAPGTASGSDRVDPER